MKNNKPNSSNNCRFFIEFLLLIKISFLLGCIAEKHTQQVFPPQNQFSVANSAININTATAIELEKIPHIGSALAQKIIEHREKHGKFRKVEHLLLIDGISDKRFREIKGLVKVE